MKNKVILSFSGGMDSTVLLYKALTEYKTVHTVSFDYGQRHSKELECVKYHVERFKDRVTNTVLPLPFFKNFNTSAIINKDIEHPRAKDIIGDPQNLSYLANRNMIFLSILTGFAENMKCKEVIYGATKIDSLAGYFDGSKEFLTKINEVNALNRRNVVEIQAPLIDSDKKDIVELGVKLHTPFSRTWTCYDGEDESCGTCCSCSLRLKGFIDAGYKDPLKYKIQAKLEKVYKEKGCRDINI